MDVGDENAACAENVELIHHTVHLRRGNHRPHSGPILIVQRRHGRGFNSRSYRARAIKSVIGDVVVHEDIGAGHHDTVQSAQEGFHCW